MWIHNPATGRTELIHDEAHIKRMLDEGCREVSNPLEAQSPRQQENNVTPLHVVETEQEELISAEDGKEAHKRRYGNSKR